MNWAIRLGRIRGIDIKVHYTFLFLLAVAVLLGGEKIPFLLLALPLLFACVILHELGHSVVAQAHGVRVRDITLLPIGGVARLEEVPEEPWTELKIALAGPAVNLIIFLLLTALVLVVAALVLFGGFPAEIPALKFVTDLLGFLWWVNLSLMAFNLLPAFPLDGGRVLRAVLAMRMDFLRATKVAVAVGRVLAGGLVLAGIGAGYLSVLGVQGVGGLVWLVVIGAFVFLAGANELRLVKFRRWRKRILLPDGVELIRPGAPADPPPELARGLFFDFGVYNQREILEEFQRLLRKR